MIFNLLRCTYVLIRSRDLIKKDFKREKEYDILIICS